MSENGIKRDICRSDLHTYKGIALPEVALPEIIEDLQKFKFRSDDIVVVTVPKAGTHWVTEIVGLILADGVSENVKRDTLMGHMEFAKMTTDVTDKNVPPKLYYQELEKAPSPRVMSTHLPIRLLPPGIFKAKIIYTARNPKDTLASLYRFLGKASEAKHIKWDKILFSIFTDQFNFGAWDRHVLPFWNLRKEDNVLFLKYEDMKKEHRKAVSKIAEFIGHQITNDVLETIVEKTSLQALKSEMKRLENEFEDGYVFGKAFGKYSFFQKGVVGDWKNYFTVAQSEQFDALYRRKMAATDLTFEFE